MHHRRRASLFPKRKRTDAKGGGIPQEPLIKRPIVVPGDRQGSGKKKKMGTDFRMQDETIAHLVN